MNNNDSRAHLGKFYQWHDLPEISSLEELMDFDRSICASGDKKFLRRSDKFDFHPSQQHLFNPEECVLVTEESPGVRLRVGVKAYKIPKG